MGRRHGPVRATTRTRRLSENSRPQRAAQRSWRGLLAAARAAEAQLAAESGRLQVLDWAGYGNDGGQAMVRRLREEAPEEQARSSTYMTNESDRALAKMHAGLKARTSSGPTSGGVKYFAKSGSGRAMGSEADPELQET